MKKNLIIIVNSYPYEYGEPYLEDEVKILENYFEKIYFVIPEKQFLKNLETQNYYVPKNIAGIIKYAQPFTKAQKLKSLFNIFSTAILSEIKIIRKTYKLPITFFKLKVLLSLYAKGKDFKNTLQKLVIDESLKSAEIVLYSYWCNEFAIAIALLKQENPQFNCYTRVHGGDLYFHRNGENYLPLRTFLASQLNNIISISESGKTYLQQKINAPQLNNKIICSKIGTLPIEKVFANDVTTQLNILTLAFLSDLKRIEILIDALGTIENVNINWTHIGGGHKHYEDFVKQHATSKLDKKQNIKYEFIGSTPKHKAFEIIRQRNIHLLVNTSVYEGIPVSMMEALSMGIPVLGIDVGAVNEIVINGISGTLLPTNATYIDVAKEIIHFATLENAAFQDHKDKAFNFWQQHYSAQNNFKKLAECLTQQ